MSCLALCRATHNNRYSIRVPAEVIWQAQTMHCQNRRVEMHKLYFDQAFGIRSLLKDLQLMDVRAFILFDTENYKMVALLPRHSSQSSDPTILLELRDSL